MAFEFRLPDIGEGVVEGEIVSWKVSVGDTVAEDQPLVEVMTDKATVEIPSPTAGTVTSITGGEGDVIAVGQVFLVLDDGESVGASTTRLEPEEAVDSTPSAAPPEPKAVAAVERDHHVLRSSAGICRLSRWIRGHPEAQRAARD